MARFACPVEFGHEAGPAARDVHQVVLVADGLKQAPEGVARQLFNGAEVVGFFEAQPQSKRRAGDVDAGHHVPFLHVAARFEVGVIGCVLIRSSN